MAALSFLAAAEIRDGSAIGFAGGDIRGLVVMKSEDGRGYDDITVAIPGSDPTDLLNILGDIGGVEVLRVLPVE